MANFPGKNKVPEQYLRNLRMLSEALTQYIENGAKCETPPEYLTDAVSFLESVNKQLAEWPNA